jgi:ATP-dependent DNA helicase RecG
MLLDYPAYFDLLKLPLPESRAVILAALVDDKLIVPCEADGWDITNLSAILLAKRLDSFSALKRKSMRVIQYRCNSRIRELVAIALIHQ